MKKVYFYTKIMSLGIQVMDVRYYSYATLEEAEKSWKEERAASRFADITPIQEGWIPE